MTVFQKAFSLKSLQSTLTKAMRNTRRNQTMKGILILMASFIAVLAGFCLIRDGFSSASLNGKLNGLHEACEILSLNGYASNTSTALYGVIAEVHPGEKLDSGCVRLCDQMAGCEGFEHREVNSACVLFSAISGSYHRSGTNSWVKCSDSQGISLSVDRSSDPTLQSEIRQNGVEEVMRNGYVGPKQLCSYREAEIKALLRSDHGCGPGERNTIVRGKWVHFSELGNNLQDDVECIVTCTHKRRPCPDKTCLFPFYLRKGTTDPRVAYQMLEESNFAPLNKIKSFHSILDAGANLGVGAAIFATMYPEAQIVCVEPSQKNFEILRRNTERFKNVIRVHAGLWPRSAPLSLVQGSDKGEWAFEVKESNAVGEGFTVVDTLMGVSVPFILDVTGLDYFEFAKIDIEGSEKELLMPAHNDMSWLWKMKLAVLEVHDHMRKGSKDAAFDALTKGEWSFLFRSGEEDFFGKPEMKKILSE